MSPALVVGLGHLDRGDDAVGPTVAARVRELGTPAVDVVEGTEPIQLLDLWGGYETVVVVDAVRSDDPSGTLVVREPAAVPLPPSRGTASSHSLDLAGVVELARSLDQLPERLVLVGVVGAGFAVGEPLSDQVRGALDDAVRSVLAVLPPDG